MLSLTDPPLVMLLSGACSGSTAGAVDEVARAMTGFERGATEHRRGRRHVSNGPVCSALATRMRTAGRWALTPAAPQPVRRHIARVPHTHRYILTREAMHIAAFNNTLDHHILRPGWAVLAQPDLDTPAPLDRAIHHLAAVTSDLFDQVHSKPEPSAAAA